MNNFPLDRDEFSLKSSNEQRELVKKLSKILLPLDLYTDNLIKLCSKSKDEYLLPKLIQIIAVIII